MLKSKVLTSRLCGLAALLLCAAVASAQPPKKENAPPPDQDPFLAFLKAEAKAGPTKGDITDGVPNTVIAEVQVPAKYYFLQQPAAKKFADMTKNMGGQEWGGVLIYPDLQQFLVFEFSSEGYIKDADKEKIDGDSILKNIQEGNKQQNATRKAQGMPVFDIDGWETPPFYDPETKNLTWALRLKTGASSNINHDVRMLGRRGTMRITLVCDPEEYKVSKTNVNALLKTFAFTKGNTYGEFTSGDKIAAYGLAGLIAGGGVAFAAKTGLLATLGKFMKFIIIGVIAVGAAVLKFFGSMFMGKRREQ